MKSLLDKFLESMISYFRRREIPPDAVQVVQRPLAAPPPAHRARHPPRHGHVRRNHLRQLPGIQSCELTMTLV